MNISYFNSIKVRLEHFKAVVCPLGDPHFNSIKVRLEHTADTVTDKIVTHFNSIKVRLERKWFNRRPLCVKFQFHKGTIRTLPRVGGVFVCPVFQFHKGTIRTYDDFNYPAFANDISIP